MNPIKSSVKKLFATAGYDVIKKDTRKPDSTNVDLAMYKRLYSADSIQHKRFYNVGSGTFSHPYWTNLDYMSEWYSNVQTNFIHVDLMKKEPLPILPGSAEVIYSSHTIEHIKDDAVEVFFKEAYRSLKPGGYLRITTGPDADTDYDALIRKDSDWFYWDNWYSTPGTYEKMYFKPPASVSVEERWLHHVASQLSHNSKSPSKVKLSCDILRTLIVEKPKEELLDYLTSMCEFQPECTGNHVSWWNCVKIERVMKKAGFEKTYKSGYGQSQCPILRNTEYFDNTHPQMSVYVEAIR